MFLHPVIVNVMMLHPCGANGWQGAMPFVTAASDFQRSAHCAAASDTCLLAQATPRNCAGGENGFLKRSGMVDEFDQPVSTSMGGECIPFAALLQPVSITVGLLHEPPQPAAHCFC